MNSELFPSPPHSSERLLFTPAAGYRDRVSGALVNVGTGGSYSAAASLSATNSRGSILWFTLHETSPLYAGYRANARTVRCVQASAREVCHSRCRHRRQRDAFHLKGPGMRGEPINRRFPLHPKRSPGSPERPNFQRKPTPQPMKHPKRRTHPNRPNAEHTNTRKSPKHPPAPDSMDSENPPGYRNAAPDRGHPSRPEQHKKKRERSPARAMRKKPPLPPFVRLTSARRGYASPRREWRCRPT